MNDDPFSPPPPIGGQRGPLGGSAGMWKWIAIAMVVLAVSLIGPTLGTGSDSVPVNDPYEDGPTGVPPNDQPAEDEITRA